LGDNLTEIRVACYGFNVRSLQREILSIQTMEITRAGLHIVEILGRKFDDYTARAKTAKVRTGVYNGKKFRYKLDPNIEPTLQETHLTPSALHPFLKLDFEIFVGFYCTKTHF